MIRFPLFFVVRQSRSWHVNLVGGGDTHNISPENGPLRFEIRRKTSWPPQVDWGHLSNRYLGMGELDALFVRNRRGDGDIFCDITPTLASARAFTQRTAHQLRPGPWGTNLTRLWKFPIFC